MTAQEAYDYIAGILPDFQRKGETLYSQLHAANVLRAQYRSNGYDDTEISQVYEEILSEYNQWTSIMGMITPIATVFGISGLGIDPVTLLTIGGTLVAIAAALLAFYANNRIQQHSEAIKRIAAYIPLSAEDKAIVDDATTTNWFSFPGLSSIGQYLLIGGAIYLAIILFRK